jgi:hypothetical protein
MTMTTKNESKALEEIRDVRRGLLELARALLHAATTTVLAAAGAVVALADVALVELTKRVGKPTPGGERRPVHRT